MTEVWAWNLPQSTMRLRASPRIGEWIESLSTVLCLIVLLSCTCRCVLLVCLARAAVLYDMQCSVYIVVERNNVILRTWLPIECVIIVTVWWSMDTRPPASHCCNWLARVRLSVIALLWYTVHWSVGTSVISVTVSVLLNVRRYML